jgi:hypothetical protein
MTLPNMPPSWVLERIENLSYKPGTGYLIWSIPPNPRLPIDSRAGNVWTNPRTGNQCRRICFKHIRYGQKNIKEHHIAYYKMKGIWPSKELDHHNRDGTDNRWINLRLATPSQQTINSKRRKDNTSGQRGVHWDSKNRKWRAVIGINGERIFCGNFITKKAAVTAYRKAQLQYHDREFIPKEAAD